VITADCPGRTPLQITAAGIYRRMPSYTPVTCQSTWENPALSSSFVDPPNDSTSEKGHQLLALCRLSNSNTQHNDINTRTNTIHCSKINVLFTVMPRMAWHWHKFMKVTYNCF